MTLVGLDRLVWSYPGALFLSAGGYHHHLGTRGGRCFVSFLVDEGRETRRR